MLIVGLPIESPITVRKVDQPARRIITRMSQRWRGDRYGFRLSRCVHEPTNSAGGAYGSGNRHHARGFLLNLVTGFDVPAPLIYDREDGGFYGVAGELTDGEALVMFRQKAKSAERDADVTFIVPADRVTDGSTRLWLSADDRVNEQLAVARDAILASEREWQRALEITRDVMPKTHAIVLALFRRERTIMMETA